MTATLKPKMQDRLKRLVCRGLLAYGRSSGVSLGVAAIRYWLCDILDQLHVVLETVG